MIGKLTVSSYKEKLIKLWKSLNQGEKEKFLFKRVTLDQNIPDIMNEKEMQDIFVSTTFCINLSMVSSLCGNNISCISFSFMFSILTFSILQE